MKPTLSVLEDNSIFPVVLTPHFHIPHQSFRKTCWPYFWIIIKTWLHQLHYHHAGPVHHLSSELLQQSPNKASYVHPDPSKSVLNTAIRMVLLKFKPEHVTPGPNPPVASCLRVKATVLLIAHRVLYNLVLITSLTSSFMTPVSHCTPATLALLLPQTN